MLSLVGKYLDYPFVWRSSFTVTSECGVKVFMIMVKLIKIIKPFKL